MNNRPSALLLSGALLLVLSACGERGSSASNEVRQTHFPGGVTSGGGTSGEVMARAAPSRPAATPAPEAKSSGEGQRGQATAPGGSVSGTPGIPEGAGGTASGAAMGGTTEGAAGSKAAPPPQQTPGAPTQQQR